MGFFSEAKRNFIARSEEARADIIYRYPEKNIRLLTQLTCQPDESAVFVKNGQVVGVLGPGQHSLSSNNIPFLSSLLEKVTGGDLFIAEIYFVSMREITGVRFGGPLGAITDSVTQMMCEAKVFGDFSVVVTDPAKLIFGSVGSGRQLQTNNAFLDWFKSILLKFMSDAVGELGMQGWSLNKMLSPHFKLELQKALLEQIKEEVDRYGLSIVQFGNFVLSIGDEDKAELNKRNMAIADDERRMKMAQNPAYMAVAQAEMMRGAGQGMSKGGEGAGGALAGMGMGMGMGLANMFQQQQQGVMQPSAASTQSLPQPQMLVCPSCGQGTAPGKFCNQCGQPLAPPMAKCACGADLAPSAKFCNQCGKPAGPKKCECGEALAAGVKFCAGCGKPTG
ncbi:MAG: SPFH domain-containing protein [Myxococcales bacterium]|jgi:membrane protease subunit (stomatin/prohibitin family)|nr:SPFH domain-containing protein [Myxococcales bacterium]